MPCRAILRGSRSVVCFVMLRRRVVAILTRRWSMGERNERQSSAQPGLLFGDMLNDEAIARVESIEVSPDDSLAKILADVKASPICGACKAGMPVVFGEGPSQAELMIIGEGPGVDDIHSELRGQVFKLRLNDREMPVLPTFNPAYLLRVAEKKREAWEDLKLVRELLKK